MFNASLCLFYYLLNSKTHLNLHHLFTIEVSLLVCCHSILTVIYNRLWRQQKKLNGVNKLLRMPVAQLLLLERRRCPQPQNQNFWHQVLYVPLPLHTRLMLICLWNIRFPILGAKQHHWRQHQREHHQCQYWHHDPTTQRWWKSEKRIQQNGTVKSKL